MSSLSRTIRRQAQRQRLNTVDRRLCPDCRNPLHAYSVNKLRCRKCKKVFVRKERQ